MGKFKIVGKAQNIGFFLIDSEVWRGPINKEGEPRYGLDVYQKPLDKRWECTFDHWERNKNSYNWVQHIN